jgi:acyl-CoA reductase-like NAD-dependent aldehyde dehydrogenase
MIKNFDMTIGGKTVIAQQYAAVHSPSTGEVVGYAPMGEQQHVDAAVAAATAAFAEWRYTDEETRRNACRQIAKVCQDNAAELSELLTLEQGKPLKGLGSEFELGGCAAWANATADMGLPVKILQDDSRGRIEMHRMPIGVVGSITPWNWPLMIAIWHVVPAGGRILTGGRPTGKGYFYPVTLVADVTEGIRLVDEEQFGPVLPIIRYHDVDDAIRRATNTEFGLDASVWSQDRAAAEKVADRLEAGTVWINKHAEIAPHVPMGGIKSSSAAQLARRQYQEGASSLLLNPSA